jgi:hypothetical protein
MAILYIDKIKIMSLEEDGEAVAKLPLEIKSSSWNKHRKAVTIKAFDREYITDSSGYRTGIVRYNFAIFDTIELAKNFVIETSVPPEYQSAISEWNKLYNIAHEHKFYTIGNIDVNSVNVTTITATLSDADIESSIDTSTLIT